MISSRCFETIPAGSAKILASRHGVEIGRNTMCRWAELAAFWLRPLYQRIHEGLRQGGYLQADETPVRYLAPGTGKTGQGYLWILHRPGGDVLFQWHASRGSACLEDLLGCFRGILQCEPANWRPSDEAKAAAQMAG